MICAIGLLVSSCNTQMKLTLKNNEAFCNYLTTVVNDTVYYELPEYKIVENSIYPILDSAINSSERCRYFDSRVRFLNSFLIRKILKDGKEFFSVMTNLSPAQALGVFALGVNERKEFNDIGGFMYRNHFFVISSSILAEQNRVSGFPFAAKTGGVLKVRAPRFFDEKWYSSYISFDLQNAIYKIEENQTCGNQILITRSASQYHEPL